GVSNPVCYPSFRASASRTGQEVAFSTGVPPDIYAFHHYTGNSTSLSCLQFQLYRVTLPSVAGGFHTRLARPPARSLRPVNPDNARHLRITAAAGTYLAVAYSSGTVIIVP